MRMTLLSPCTPGDGCYTGSGYALLMSTVPGCDSTADKGGLCRCSNTTQQSSVPRFSHQTRYTSASRRARQLAGARAAPAFVTGQW